MKESYLSTSIFSFTVHEKAFKRLSCTVIGEEDTSNIVQNWILIVFCAARYQWLHGTVPVRGSWVGNHCAKGKIRHSGIGITLCECNRSRVKGLCCG